MSFNFNSPYGEAVSPENLALKGTYRVRLSSVGNPDHGQDPHHPLYGAEPNRWQDVASLEEASAACRQFIQGNDLGAGNWAGGDVEAAGKIVARVSYNGRVWMPAAEAATATPKRSSPGM